MDKARACRLIEHAEFFISDVVYLRVEQEKNPGMVTQVVITPSGLMYGVQFSDGHGEYYAMELTTEFVSSFS